MDFKNFSFEDELDTPKLIKKMRTATTKDTHKIVSERMRKQSRKVKYVDFALASKEDND